MIQCNKLMHLEDSMVMYGIYNAETLEKLTGTVHHMHSITTSNEKLFAGKYYEKRTITLSHHAKTMFHLVHIGFQYSRN